MAASTSVAERVGLVAETTVSGIANALVNVSSTEGSNEVRKRPVTVALRRLERDLLNLDNMADARPQLTDIEFAILSSTVTIAAASPYLLSLKLVEVLVPSMAALSAAIGLSAEYVGKVSVSRGKEVAAVTLQAAAEAEAKLAQAERAKAIIPLCVGLSATFAAFSLLVPALLAELAATLGVQGVTEIYLIFPILAALVAAVASLAVQETAILSAQACGVGARRFATSGVVGRTWLSATEQIESSSSRLQAKWFSFALGVLPAPALGVLCPGNLGFKAIVAAATAAAQTAFSLARAEYSIARAVDAVALKSRSAAVSDTYANQGARAGAILPFTSALSSLCAAVSVAVVEVLPFFGNVPLQSAVCVAFPFVGSLVAAAASVSKARCEVDAAAATAAAQELASTPDVPDLAFLSPVRGVLELIRLTLKPSLERARNFLLKLRYRTMGREGQLLAARTEWRQQFELLDADGDGRLGAAELAEALPAFSKLSWGGVDAGRISLVEARSIIVQLQIAADAEGSVSWPRFASIMRIVLFPDVSGWEGMRAEAS